MLVDSHCHLDLLAPDVEGGLDAVLGAAAEAGVGHMLCVSVDRSNFPAVRAIAAAHDHVFATAGVHPNHRDDDLDGDILAGMASDPEVVAVGETGLDYFRSEGDLDWQREQFRRHIAVAREVDKPLVIHMREATDDTLGILKEEGADRVGGVMHCFAEDWDAARRALDLGFLISFSGIVTFRSAETLREVAAKVPRDMFLVETDAPWLAPVPYRGKTNQPAYVRHVAEVVAAQQGADLETTAARSSDNFFRLLSRARRAQADAA
jgi:TatD DNase family protein